MLHNIKCDLKVIIFRGKTSMANMKVIRTVVIDAPRLGAKIKAARLKAKKRGLDLTEICKIVGMTTSNWYRIENEDTKGLPEETLKKIEEVLKVDLGVNFNNLIAA